MDKRILILLAVFTLIPCAQAACKTTDMQYSCDISIQESTCAAEGAQYYREQLKYSNISGTCCTAFDTYRVCYYEAHGPEGIMAELEKRKQRLEEEFAEYVLYEMCGGPLMMLPIAMFTAAGLELLILFRKST
ncbi:MAG: hypothetical protein FJY77_04390 [Candidatus Altiarchaeales archaeon]|nr:hypothetical protein [Candidatus Altiarchaeales archaeon]